ncbi:UNVERIFIED_CONTAM: hypothetical protein FKN15_054900 [Acipenser sinensis]
MAQGSLSSTEEAGGQQGAKTGGEDEVRKGRFPGHQGEWMRWESVEQRKIGWTMEQSRISFLIRSTYDVLPSPQNLNL